MAEGGWLKLYRTLIQKPIWKLSTPEQKAILITIMCMVNHDTEEWEWKGKKYICKPGQKITSLKKIADEAGKGISIQNVRTALERFEKLEFLTNESTKESRLIIVQNWDVYQSKENNQQSNQQTGNKGVTTNKNDKELKKKDICAFFEAIWNLYPNKKGKGQISDTQKSKLFAIGFDELSRCIDRYRHSKETWKAWQNGSTFFNSGYVDYLDCNYKPEQQNDTGQYRDMSDYDPFKKE